ncbi:DsbC family protein [Marinobacter sp. BGYM27]|uniref:DsbC family protein n=1 Tax=Marinobacter sp. BGYM27 TaxID=2975597 RepID=UPI0021A6AFED|nr:DsbC family protein [Marinobacter sp. BGYM27]MDG5498259.1 DsbC family protein [Marinobacter sp. BGYM27]
MFSKFNQSFGVRGVLACLLMSMAAAGASAAEPDKADPVSAIKSRLTSSVPGLEILDVSPAGTSGLYKVTTNNKDMIYTTQSGEFFLVGDLYQISDKGIANVTESDRAAQRVKALADVDRKDMISYVPEGDVKAQIYVFTDIDCPYCRKLHEDVPRLNELGVQVNYLGYPRSGPGTPSFKKYIAVWCSDDRQGAMDNAKQGVQVPAKSCENPIADQFALGGRLGVTGTPAIILDDGHMVRGYVPADDLAKGMGIL